VEKNNGNSCNNNCGLFDFMANTIGIKVLHPGGYEATEKICTLSNLNEKSHVLDLACGTGTTSFFLSRKYKCKITGIDISNSLIDVAIKNLKKFKKNAKITFEVADAFKIPYPDNTFDFVIAQAFFILIDEKEKALNEIYRVLKSGGYFGSLELSWFKTPTKEAYDELLIKTCNNFIPRMIKFEEWEVFYKSKNFKHIKTIKNPMTSGMLRMLKTEGVFNFVNILIKMMFNSINRKRMMDVQKTFNKYNDYVGYGIFCFNK
jgi:ubiquinone/menaquinone biosynthesis C-methylase UbiE